MNKLYKFLFFLSISGALFSCEKEVILDFDDEEQSLAIFSLFSPNSNFDQPNFEIEVTATPVSYTHLTLPTICSV